MVRIGEMRWKLGASGIVFIRWRTATIHLGMDFDPPTSLPKSTHFFFASENQIVGTLEFNDMND